MLSARNAFFKDLFIHERHTERGRDIGRGRRSRLHAGSPMWDSILDPGITPWTKGRCSMVEPPRHPCWILSNEIFKLIWKYSSVWSKQIGPVCWNSLHQILQFSHYSLQLKIWFFISLAKFIFLLFFWFCSLSVYSCSFLSISRVSIILNSSSDNSFIFISLWSVTGSFL